MAQCVAMAIDILVHRDEPLRRITKDHRLLRSPRMRILMLEPTARDQHAGGEQSLDDCLVGVAFLTGFSQYLLAGESGRLLGEAAVGIDGVGNGGVDALRGKLGGVGGPHVEVVAAKPWRGVYKAGAGVLGNVIAWEQRHREVIAPAKTLQRMLTKNDCQIIPFDLSKSFVSRNPGLPQDIEREFIRENEQVSVLGPIVQRRVGNLIESIFDARRKADGAVAGNCPRSCRPDYD